MRMPELRNNGARLVLYSVLMPESQMDTYAGDVESEILTRTYQRRA